jgi:lipoate-protein ligase A
MTVIDTGVADAQENMAIDAQLLAELETPILHLYDWAQPSVTYGHFIDVKKYLKAGGLAVAKRPTGGGIVFHIWDLAFSFLLPAGHPQCSDNTLENYAFVNGIVLEVVQEYLSLEPTLIPEHAPLLAPDCTHFCMARPTIYDVVHNGLKIAGAAQRRTKRGYLHQGTISLCAPDVDLLREVLLQEEILRAMTAYSFAPRRREELPQARRDVQEILRQKFAERV